MFKKLEGTTAAGNVRTLFKSTILNVAQMTLVDEIKAHFNGETLLTRKQLRDAHGVLRGKKACPYFISKNMACKTKTHGVYNIAVLKVSAAALKEANAPAPAVTESNEPKPKKKAAKKTVAKKESAPKKGKKTPAAEPAVAAAE